MMWPGILKLLPKWQQVVVFSFIKKPLSRDSRRKFVQSIEWTAWNYWFPGLHYILVIQIGSQVISLQVSNDGFINKLLVLHLITWVVIATLFVCLVRIIDLNIYVPINVNLEGLLGGGGGGRGGRAKARDLNSKQFFGSNAQPQGNHNWSKEDKFPTPPTKTRGQKCFIERKNILTFWESRIRFFQQFIVEIKCCGEMPASWRSVFHLHSLTNLQLLNKQIHLLSRLD